MGFFELVFGKVDVLAVVAFVFATLFITSGLKSVFRKLPVICYWLDNDFAKVCLSWAVGAGVFAIMHLALTDFPITQGTVLQFGIWVLLLNGGYRIITTVRDMIRDWKNKQN
jgi:uncharacterized membrane protein YjjP (DUF1212 family)